MPEPDKFASATSWANRVNNPPPPLSLEELLGEDAAIDPAPVLSELVAPRTAAGGSSNKKKLVARVSTEPTSEAANPTVKINPATPSEFDLAVFTARLTEADNTIKEKTDQFFREKAANAKLVHELGGARALVAAHEAELESCRAALAAEKSAVADAGRLTAAAEASAAATQEDAEQLRAELASASAELLNLKAEHERTLEERQATAQAALDGAESAARKGQSRAIEDAITKVTEEWGAKLDQAVSDERGRLNKKYALLQADYKGLEPRYKAIQAELQTKAAALELDVSFTKSELQTVKDELAAEKAKHKTCRKNLKKARANLTTVTAKYDDIAHQHTVLESSYAKLTAQAGSLKTMVDNSDKATIEAESVATETNHRLEELTKREKQLRDTNAELEAKLAAAESEASQVTTLTTELASAGAQSAEISIELEDRSRRVTELEEQLNVIRAEHTTTLKTGREKELAAIKAESQVNLTEQRLELEQAGHADTAAALKTTNAHSKKLAEDLDVARAEAAALAAVAASSGYGLKMVAVKIETACAKLVEFVATSAGIGLRLPHRRAVAIDPAEDGLVLGLELIDGPAKSDGTATGARVDSIATGGRAATSGQLDLGDVILEIDGISVMDKLAAEVLGILEAKAATEPVTLTVASADEVDEPGSPYFTAAKAPAEALLTDVGGGNITKDACDDNGGSGDGDGSSSAGSDPEPGLDGTSLSLAELAAYQIDQQLAAATATVGSAIDVVADLGVALSNAVEQAATNASRTRRSQSRASRLDRVLNRLETEKGRALDRVKEVEMELASLQTELGTKAATNAELSETVKKIEADSRKFELSKVELATALDAAKVQLGEETTKVEALRNELDAAFKEVEELSGRVKLKETEVDVAQAETRDERERISALQTVLLSAQETNLQLENDIQIARTNEYAMSQELITTSASRDAAEADNAAGMSRSRELEVELVELRAELRHASTTLKSTEGIKAKAESDGAAKATELAQLRSELEASQAEQATLQAGLSETIAALAQASLDKPSDAEAATVQLAKILELFGIDAVALHVQRQSISEDWGVEITTTTALSTFEKASQIAAVHAGSPMAMAGLNAGSVIVGCVGAAV